MPIATTTTMRRTAGAALLLALAACGGDSAVAPGGEEELITRVTLSLNAAGTAIGQTAYIDDPDGNGPQSPSAQVGTLTLANGQTYVGTVRFTNETVNPAEDITAEVEAESDEHRVFYTVTGAGVTVTTTDTDTQGRPLGLRFTLAAQAGTQAGPRTLRVVLCHYSDNPKPAVATSCTLNTDIDVSFNLTVN